MYEDSEFNSIYNPDQLLGPLAADDLNNAGAVPIQQDNLDDVYFAANAAAQAPAQPTQPVTPDAAPAKTVRQAAAGTGGGPTASGSGPAAGGDLASLDFGALGFGSLKLGKGKPGAGPQPQVDPGSPGTSSRGWHSSDGASGRADDAQPVATARAAGGQGQRDAFDDWDAGEVGPGWQEFEQESAAAADSPELVRNAFCACVAVRLVCGKYKGILT